MRDGRIASATIGGRAVEADFYVAALPVEVMRTLLSPELRAAEPRLNGLDRLVTRWMNGILFYLAEDLPLVHGHAIYLDSEWALTSISQRQFWKTFDYDRIGGILSLDISEWQRAGRRTGKVAAMCTPDEIRTEVWGQLQDHLEKVLDGVEVREWFLDEAIEFPNPSGATNAEPLLVNTNGSWADRPDASLRIPNLVLAADYVRTYTDLATMEGANEAARRAVNAILDAVGSSAVRCDVWKLREPPVLVPRGRSTACCGGCAARRRSRCASRRRARSRRPALSVGRCRWWGGCSPSRPLAARDLGLQRVERLRERDRTAGRATPARRRRRLLSIAYSRRLPSARTVTSPASRSTLRCCETAGCEIGSASTTAPAGCSPEASISRICRRVGSPRASKTTQPSSGTVV